MTELQSLRCPTCGGSLNLKNADGRTIICPYCHASIVYPKELQETGGTPKTNPLDDDPTLVPQILQLMKENRTVKAVRLYKYKTGLGLKESKEAVERLVAKDQARTEKWVENQKSAKKVFVLILAIGAVVMIACLVVGLLFMS